MQIVISPTDEENLSKACVSIYNFSKNKNYISGSKINIIDPSVVIEENTRHPDKHFLTMGAFSYCRSASTTMARAKIGRFCSIAPNVSILDGAHPLTAASTSEYSYSAFNRNVIPENIRHVGPITNFKKSYGQTIIGNDVWIGANACLRGGVAIGDGSVIAAHSFVVKDVEPYSIVGGNPAKKIRFRFDNEIIKDLLHTRWWDYGTEILREMDFNDPRSFISNISRYSKIKHAATYGKITVEKNDAEKCMSSLLYSK